VDVTTGSSVFPTSLFYQLIPPREVLRSNLAPYRQYQRTTTTSAVDIKSLKSCKLTLSLINVLSFRITTDQYRTLNGSICAVHQSFSGFNTVELGRLHSPQLSLVVWQLALTCDGLPLFAICAILAWILLSLVVAGLPCCFTAGGNAGSDAISFTYHNFRSPIWRYNYGSKMQPDKDLEHSMQ